MLCLYITSVMLIDDRHFRIAYQRLLKLDKSCSSSKNSMFKSKVWLGASSHTNRQLTSEAPIVLFVNTFVYSDSNGRTYKVSLHYLISTCPGMHTLIIYRSSPLGTKKPKGKSAKKTYKTFLNVLVLSTIMIRKGAGGQLTPQLNNACCDANVDFRDPRKLPRVRAVP